MTQIGILGEDRTDTETVRELLRRIVPKGTGLQMRSPARGGCSALRRRATAFMEDLYLGGCRAVVFVHDLDLSPENNELNSEDKLRKELKKIPIPAGIECLICIPVEELEAWFWCDQAILERVGKGCAKAFVSPHNVKRPKEKLMGVSRRAHKRCVYSTNMNPDLAKILDLDLCAERCPAFAELRAFVQKTYAGALSQGVAAP